MSESTLILEGWRDGVYGDHVVWHNPAGLGHAFIKLRKQSAEYRIIERLMQRRTQEVVVAAIVGGTRNDRPL